MPVLDGNFEAFVTNLGKYNEGMLVGEWVKLPTTEEEMQKVFERIGIGKQDEFGQPYEEWFITDYECPIYGVQKMLGEYESLDKLNYLAALIDELSLSDQEKLVAIMESGCDEVSDIDDLINLTFNLDCYDIMHGINDKSDLGYYYVQKLVFTPKRISALWQITKSQQALKLQQEQNKQERKEKRRKRKEAEEQRMFELKQRKKLEENAKK
mgnify:CR=1 FL=1